jgi:hypothetical protein
VNLRWLAESAHEKRCTKNPLPSYEILCKISTNYESHKHCADRYENFISPSD